MKIRALFLFIAFFCFSSLAFGGQTGVYIAPKLIYSYHKIDDSKLKLDSDGNVSDFGSLDSKSDSAFGGSFAVGYDLQQNMNIPIRAEIEYALRSESKGKYSRPYDDGSGLIKGSGSMNFKVQSVFLNIYYDIETGTKFTPYLGGGLGVAIIDANGKLQLSQDDVVYLDQSASNTETNFAFNLAAGVGYDVSDKLTMDLGYRYADFGEGKTGEIPVRTFLGNDSLAGKARIVAHEVLFGIRYKF